MLNVFLCVDSHLVEIGYNFYFKCCRFSADRWQLFEAPKTRLLSERCKCQSVCRNWCVEYFTIDPTRITQGPVDMEIIVGESIVLPCQVASDPVLDVSFSWAFNGQLISKGDGHFELVGGVSDLNS